MTLNTKPIAPKERIEMLDIVRGFALLGVLIANLPAFKSSAFYYTPPLDSIASPVDALAAWFIKLFVEGKFYTIFSFLFGLGFYIFMERASEVTDKVAPLFRRRLLVLLGFGLIHVLFLWTGDILHTYAIAGLFLIRKWKFELPRLKKRIIFNLILATILLGGIYFLNNMYINQVGRELYVEQMLAKRADIIDVFQRGSYSEILNTRLSIEVINAFINNLFIIPNVLALFLMGLYIGKSQIHKNIYQHRDIIKRTWVITLIAGIIANSLLFVLMRQEAAGNISWLKEIVKYYAGIIICFFYITSIILIGDTKGGLKIIRPFAYVGRMALTNYLVQTLICITIFYGYGFGYFGRIGFGMGIIIALAIYMIQIVYSFIWFKYFSYGPMEWVWRRLTYGTK